LELYSTSSKIIGKRGVNYYQQLDTLVISITAAGIEKAVVLNSVERT